MSDSIDKLAIKFEQEGIKTIEFINSIPDGVLDNQLYQDGDQWTIRKTCVHIVDAERSIATLIQNVIAGGEGVPDDFDLDRYNASRIKKMGELSKAEIAKKFTDLRSETVKMISNFKDGQLELTGRHPYKEDATIRDMLKLILLNASSHVHDIRQLLG